MKTMTNHSRKGFVLISALLITSISLLLLIPYASGVIADMKLTSMTNYSVLALDLAEAGVERAIWEIRYNGKSSDFTIPVTSFQSSAGDSKGEYEVTVALPDANSANIKSYGYAPNKSSYKSKKIIVVKYAFHRAFGRGITGAGGITMSGQADIDSYDSTALNASGNPAGYDGLKADGTYNKGQQGDIASNGAITLSGQSKVWGNANPGPGYPFSGVPNVTGTYGTLPAPITIDPIPDAVVAAALANNVNGNITKTVMVGGVPTQVPYTITGYNLSDSTDEINLPGGTYYFASISISGTAKIKILGPSTVYVVGNINISGQGIVNTGTMPKDLLLYSTGSDIKVSGQAPFYGAIYAPNATVTYTGQSDFYGSIVCGHNVDKGQAGLHYDKALANVMPGFVVNKVTSWQEAQQ